MEVPQHLKTRQLRRGNLGSIEQDEFSDLILAFVFAFNSGARRQKIIELIHDTFREQFRKPDYELLQSQKPKERWIHNIDWAKRKLVHEGFLLRPPDAPYGTWVLTEKGKRSAEILWKGSGL